MTKAAEAVREGQGDPSCDRHGMMVDPDGDGVWVCASRLRRCRDCSGTGRTDDDAACVACGGLGDVVSDGGCKATIEYSEDPDQ